MAVAMLGLSHRHPHRSKVKGSKGVALGGSPEGSALWWGPGGEAPPFYRSCFGRPLDAPSE